MLGGSIEEQVQDFISEFGKNFETLQCLFEQRNRMYKNGWDRSGKLMSELFPEGVELRSEEDFARFGLVEMLAAKLSRYCSNFEAGGHRDSIKDLCVYANILFTYDRNQEGRLK